MFQGGWDVAGLLFGIFITGQFKATSLGNSTHMTLNWDLKLF